MSDVWVLDATIWTPPGEYCWIPIEPDGTLIVGMNLISDEPPKGWNRSIVHLDGQDACDAWVAAHRAELDDLKRRHIALAQPAE